MALHRLEWQAGDAPGAVFTTVIMLLTSTLSVLGQNDQPFAGIIPGLYAGKGLRTATHEAIRARIITSICSIFVRAARYRHFSTDHRAELGSPLAASGLAAVDKLCDQEWS
jgi:hypothetical protein